MTTLKIISVECKLSPVELSLLAEGEVFERSTGCFFIREKEAEKQGGCCCFFGTETWGRFSSLCRKNNILTKKKS